MGKPVNMVGLYGAGHMRQLFKVLRLTYLLFISKRRKGGGHQREKGEEGKRRNYE